MGEDKRDEGRDAKMSDALRKILSVGISGALLSEEVIRSYLGDLRLPKELLQTLIQGAVKSRDEMTSRVSKEVLNLAQKVNWTQEVSKFAQNHKFKITAEIEITKKDNSSVS